MKHHETSFHHTITITITITITESTSGNLRLKRVESARTRPGVRDGTTHLAADHGFSAFGICHQAPQLCLDRYDTAGLILN